MQPTSQRAEPEPLVVGRYTLYDTLARGGMASVHVGRLASVGGFARTVAIKRLHPNLAADPDFVSMLLDEARMVTRIRHPHVVQTLDVVSAGNELLLVMDYVEGESLSRLLRSVAAAKGRVPVPIAVAIAVGVLEGLHAAHEARSDSNELLDLVHRDVSPQNVLVGTDGVARLIDFGVAKAVGRSRETENGQVKGKLSYMSPEQVRGEDVDRRTDIFALSVVLWEMLTGRRLFAGKNEGDTILQVLERPLSNPASLASDITRELDSVVMRGLARDLAVRFPTALEMAHALEAATMIATPREIARWVAGTAGETLAERRRIVERVERAPLLSNARTVPELEPLPRDGVGPQSLPTRALSADSPAQPGHVEPGTLTQASSSLSVSSKHVDATRALWVVLGVVALGMLIGGLALARLARESTQANEAPPLTELHRPRLTPSSASAAPSRSGEAPAASQAASAPVAPPSAPKPARAVVKPASPAPARSALYGRE